jgi:protein-disulfide isomerase
MPRATKPSPKKASSPAPVKSVSTRTLYYLLVGVLVLIVGIVITLILLTKQANNVVPSTNTTQVQRSVKPTQPGFATDELVNTIPEIKSTDIVFGDASAPVVLYEYADLECPYCKKYQPVLTQLEDIYSGKLAVVFRHFPLTIHPNAPMESQILACVAADDMEKARNLIVLNYKVTTATGTSFTSDQYLDLAAQVGADRAKTATCFQNQEQKSVVDQSRAEGLGLGIDLTPTTFIVRKSDGRTVRILGSYGLTEMQTAVEFMLP